MGSNEMVAGFRKSRAFGVLQPQKVKATARGSLHSLWVGGLVCLLGLLAQPVLSQPLPGSDPYPINPSAPMAPNVFPPPNSPNFKNSPTVPVLPVPKGASQGTGAVTSPSTEKLLFRYTTSHKPLLMFFYQEGCGAPCKGAVSQMAMLKIQLGTWLDVQTATVSPALLGTKPGELWFFSPKTRTAQLLLSGSGVDAKKLYPQLDLKLFLENYVPKPLQTPLALARQQKKVLILYIFQESNTQCKAFAPIFDKVMGELVGVFSVSKVSSAVWTKEQASEMTQYLQWKDVPSVFVLNPATGYRAYIPANNYDSLERFRATMAYYRQLKK